MSDQYKYTAFTESGETKEGVVTANSSEQAVNILADRDLKPVSLKRVNSEQSLSFWGFFRRQEYENLIVFTNNLSTLFKAGIPILRILALIKIGPANSRFNLAIANIRFQMQAGQSLSKAMSDHRELFSDIYVASIAAGEESGQLDQILDELSPTLENELELSRDIKSGIRYPVFVVTAIGLAFLVLMTFVIPRFVSFYGAFNTELPLPTRIVMTTSEFITQYWPLFIGLVLALVFGFVKLAGTVKGKLWIDRQFLKVPVFGQIIIKGSVARFAMMFAILFRAGIPIVKATEILRGSIKNSALANEIDKLAEMFREGQEERLTAAEFQYFPELALQMIQIGLESGSLDQILAEIGQFYSKEVRYTTRHLTAILEPLLTLILGGFILVLALAIFLPMWNLINVFKG